MLLCPMMLTLHQRVRDLLLNSQVSQNFPHLHCSLFFSTAPQLAGSLVLLYLLVATPSTSSACPLPPAPLTPCCTPHWLAKLLGRQGSMKGCVMRAEGLPQQHGTVQYLTLCLLLLLSHACLLAAHVFSCTCDFAACDATPA